MTADNLSNVGFVLNMLNAAIGIGLLAKPYAVAIVGWYSIVSVILAMSSISYVGYLFAMMTLKATANKASSKPLTKTPSATPSTETKRLLFTSPPHYDSVMPKHPMDLESSTKGLSVTQSTAVSGDDKKKSIYTMLAQQALGKYGQYYVNLGITMSISSTFVVDLIVEWQCLVQILYYLFATKESPNNNIYLSDTYTFTYMLLFTFPIIFALNWRQVTFVSAISVVCITTIIFTIFVVFAMAMWRFDGHSVPQDLYTAQQQQSQNIAQHMITEYTLIERILFSFMVFQSGISASTSLPALIVTLKNKTIGNVRTMILISYFIITSICVSVGLFGALTFGNNVNILILNNLFVWPAGIPVLIVTAMKIVNLWSSYGILLAVICEILEKSLLNMHNAAKYKRYLLRFFIFSCTAITAYKLRHDLAFMLCVQNVIGAIFSTRATLPLLLYLSLEYRSMSVVSRIFHVLLLCVLVGTAIEVISRSGLLIK